MKTKRIKKLKQPSTGRLIYELRLLLGLTQEEMATIVNGFRVNSLEDIIRNYT